MPTSTKTWKEKQIEEERNGESGNEFEGKGDEQGSMEINMVFHLPTEFELPEQKVAQLDLGAKRAIFEKPEEMGGGTLDLYTLKGIWMGCWWTAGPVSI
jgi:hypothetical protein